MIRTTEPAPQRQILVADPDARFLEELRQDPRQARQIPIACAATGRDAQLALADRTRSFAAVLLNLALEDPAGISVIRFAHQLRPATPIFLIEGQGSAPPLAKDDLARLGIHGVLTKPLDYGKILSAAAPSHALFDPKAALDSAAKAGREAVDTEVQAEDAQFVPIRAADFLGGSKSFFDVFVRLASGRFVKILKAGDVFSPERVQQYLAKGVTHFHLRKEAQEQYLAYCDRIATSLLKRGEVRAEVKAHQAMNHGEETMSFLKAQGLSEANIGYAQGFVRNVHEAARQLNPGKNELLEGFLADVASFEHGVSTAMLASLLIAPLRIESEKPVQIVGLASLLHDIGLYRMSPEIQREDESKMSEEQKSVYRTHPAVGAQLLRGLHGVDPATVQAVAQHHQRRNHKGFPSRTGATAVNRIAEIIGISDELARLLTRKKQEPSLDLLRELEFEVFDGFTHAVTEAFRTVFFPAPANPSKKIR